MEEVFKCPQCSSVLNIGDKVVISAQTKDSGKGLYIFDSELGNYDVERSGAIMNNEGDRVEFFCPLCFNSLNSDIHENLASLVMVDNDKEIKVLFSKIAGEKATYKFGNGKLSCFGKDKELYKHLFETIK